MALPLLLFLITVILFASRRQQQQQLFASPDALISNETNAYIENVLSTWNSSGLAVAVVRRDPAVSSGWKIEFASYGLAKADGSSVSADTQFAIASNTKLFTSISVGLLIFNETLAKERGQAIDLRTKICDLLPEWKLQDDEMSTGANLQDMLSHRTGMPAHDFAGKAYTGISKMISSMRYLRPSAEFREAFQYNNHMYGMLSHLPQVLLNQTFESYVEQHIFAPLNMTSTTFSIAKAEAGGNLAHGFVMDKRDLVNGVHGSLKPAIPHFQRPGEEERTMAGVAGILSSSRDMATWMSMLLNNGKHPITNEVVIPQPILDWASTWVTIMERTASFPELTPPLYGAGQYGYSYQGHQLIEHYGNTLGFRSLITRFPSDNLGIITLSNADSSLDYATPINDAVKYRLADDILQLKRIDWNSRYLELLQNKIKMQDVIARPLIPSPPTSPLEHLDGSRFSHPAYGALTPCRVPQTRAGPMSSQPCEVILQSVPVRQILDHSDLSIPTFITPLRGPFSTHVRMQHFSGDLFNASVIWSNAEVRARERVTAGENILGRLDTNVLVEWVHDENGGGLAFKGNFFGKAFSAPNLPEQNGKAGAEVWFARDNI